MTSGATAWLVDQRWMKAYPLGDLTTIGRGPESTIMIRDPAVSREHANIERDGGNYLLRAHGSAGTTLNGIRVSTECVLQEGDVIDIAHTSLRFTLRAPTGEMFVVPHDQAFSADRISVPTRVTLHAMHPITLIARWQRYWKLLGALLLIILVITICASP